MNLKELYNLFREFLSKNEINGEEFVGRYGFGVISINTSEKTYSRVQVSLSPMEVPSSFGLDESGDIEDYVNLNDLYKLNISYPDVIDFSQFVFIIGHEFGHYEEKAFGIFQRLIVERKDLPHPYNRRFTEAEQAADDYGMKLHRKFLGYDFPPERFIRALFFNIPKETEERVHNLYPNYNY
jgi:hypothetical protein